MTEWLLQVAGQLTDRTGCRPVLLVDEEELCWSQIDDYFTVAADKNLPPYNDGRWLVYDILLEDRLDEEYVGQALQDELLWLGIDDELLSLESPVFRQIARHSQIPHFCHENRPSVYHGKRLLSLCLLQAVRRYMRTSGGLHLRGTDAALWGPHFWNKFVPRPAEGEDFHCEYIIFDGEAYRTDPYVEFSPGQIIAANAAVAAFDSWS